MHSTKSESASLPITGATNGASQKWYHAYKNDNRVTLRWWKTAKTTLYGQAFMEIQKKDGVVCVVGSVAPELLSAFVAKGKKYVTADIRTRNIADQFD